MEVYDELEKALKELEKKDKVINDLLKRISDLEFEVEKQDKEIENLEKLNNANYQSFIETNKILIELEKYIDEKNKIKVETDGYIWQLIRPSITCKDLKNKLQELKGVDKE